MDDIPTGIVGSHRSWFRSIFNETDPIKCQLREAQRWVKSPENRSSNTILHYAVERNYDRLVGRIIGTWRPGRQRMINAQNENGCTALHLAVSRRNRASVEILLRNGADVGVVNKQKRTALHETVTADNPDTLIVDMLLAAHHGRHLSDLDIHGSTVLHDTVGTDKEWLLRVIANAGTPDLIVARIGCLATPLEMAVIMKDVKRVQILLEAGPTGCGDSLSRSGSSLLEVAFQHDIHRPRDSANVAAIVRLLLKHGADVRKAKASLPYQAAYEYLQYQNVDILAALLEHGADINAVVDGRTLLQFAIRESSPDLLLVLLKTGQCPKGVNTSIVHECWEARPDYPLPCPCLRALIENRADVNALRNGSTPLHWAAARRNVEIACFLLDNGAEINSLGERARTPLFLACSGSEFRFSSDLAMVRFLLSRGANVDARDENLQTPLFYAVKEQKRLLFDLLLPHSRNLDARDLQGRHLIHHAAEGRDDSLIRSLVSQSKSCHRLGDYKGVTPLMIACKNSRYGIAKVLLEAGAPATDTDNERNTALHAAVNGDEAMVSKLLLERGADPSARTSDNVTPLSVAVTLGSESMVRLLLEHGANAKQCGSGGRPLLCVAAQRGSTSMMDALLSHGADVYSHELDRTSALTIALASKSSPMLEILLENGLDCETEIDAKGRMWGFPMPHPRYRNDVIGTEGVLSPLMLTICIGAESLVGVLLRKGANANKQDSKRRTPLHMIFERDDPEQQRSMARLLIAHGANPHVCQLVWDWTAIHYAVVKRDVDMLRILLAGNKFPNRSMLWEVEMAALTQSFPAGARLIREVGSLPDELDRRVSQLPRHLLLRHTRAFEDDEDDRGGRRTVLVGKTHRIEIDVPLRVRPS